MQDLSGSTLGGRYLLRRRLGAGGMGVVYEAWQGDLGRTVAVKLIGSLDDETLARFQREARALASLGHPHIVQVYDFQARGGEPPFLVMELLNGESLADCIKRERRLAPARVARIGAHVASALSVAHRAGIVHRDIKPANVFLVSTPTLGEVSKVLDFGIAKVEGSEGGLTQTGHVIGTLSYMSPEQAAGAPLDGRSDIYSLSACLFVALTGQKPPFPGFDLASPAPPPPELPGIDRKLAALVQKGLARSPAERFASADELAELLGAYAENPRADAIVPASAGWEATHGIVPGPVVAPTLTRPATRSVDAKPRSTPWLLVAGVVLVLGAGAAAALALFAYWYSNRGDGPPPAIASAGADAGALPAAPPLAPDPSPIASGSGATAARPLANSPASPAASGKASSAKVLGASCESDTQCPSGAVCKGTCVCPDGHNACGGSCTIVWSDKNNCGACGKACGADDYCDAGMCRACKSAGGTWCGARCVFTQKDSQNCGACGHKCTGSGVLCKAGVCTQVLPPVPHK